MSSVVCEKEQYNVSFLGDPMLHFNSDNEMDCVYGAKRVRDARYCPQFSGTNML